MKSQQLQLRKILFLIKRHYNFFAINFYYLFLQSPDLPEIAKEKLGINENQKNVLVRVTLRSLDQTLTKEYANKFLDEIYDKINQGQKGYKNVV